MNLLNFLYGGAVLGFAPLIPLYAEDRYGLSALAAGTLLTARAVGMVATSGLAVYLLRRTGYRWPIALGFLLAAGGAVATAVSPTGCRLRLAGHGDRDLRRRHGHLHPGLQ